MNVGALATLAGIRDACRDVLAVRDADGLPALRAMTEEDWRARARVASAGFQEEGGWFGPYVLAYGSAADSFTRTLLVMN